MNWHPQPSLGAVCTTKEHLSPKSTLGLSGPRDNTTGYRQQALYNLWRRVREREEGTRQCLRAGHSQRAKTGVEVLCCHPCSDVALAICSALLRAVSLDLILPYRRNFEPFSWAENSSPGMAEVAPKLPSYTSPPAASVVLGAALTSWTFSLLTRTGSGVVSLLFLSRITGVPKTFRCCKKKGLLASA